MVYRLARRSLLLGAGIGAAGRLLSRNPLARARAAESLEDLARRFRECSREAVPDVAARAIAAGADRASVLGAILLAGVEDVRPRPVGNHLHCVMMIESAFLLTEDAPAEETWLAALWALDDFKLAQEVDRDRGDWTLRPAKERKGAGGSLDECRRELAAALDAFDPGRADAAVVALLRRGGPEEAFETLWPYAGRSFTHAGHRILHAAQLERVSRRLGGRIAEPCLRTIALGLADDSKGSNTEDFARARDLATGIPERWLEGAEDPAKSVEVLAALRGRSPGESQRAVADAFRAGLGPATVWDGLRLHASELMLLRPIREHLFPVHTVTETEAFGHAFERARSDGTRRILALQAAAWMPRVRDAVVRSDGPLREERGIDALGERAEAGDLGGAVERRSTDAVSRALGRDPTLAAGYVARLRSSLVRKATQNHEFKYAGSIRVEASRTAAPWRGRILATAVDYLPGSGNPDTDLTARSLRALKAAGAI